MDEVKVEADEVQDVLACSSEIEEVTADDIYHWSEIFGISREEANKRIEEEMFRLGRTPAAWRKQREMEEKQKVSALLMSKIRLKRSGMNPCKSIPIFQTFLSLFAPTV